MLRRPTFWIGTAVICLVAGVLAFVYFPRAFPVVTLDLRMDRQRALAGARELADRFGWGPEGYAQAASFTQVGQVQEFVELEGGGPEAFREMLDEGTFHPYRWRVRHFREQEAHETAVVFTPAGDPYGFREQLPEGAPGAALPEDEALSLAESGATGDWGVDLAAWERVESSQQTRPGGRVDHTFVYERRGVSWGEGRLRLRLVVGGDDLTELTRFVDVPEAFSRRFEEMRSTNTLIGALGQIAALLGYLLGGCAVALFFLYRERWVVWRKPILWGAGIAFLQVLVTFNQLPLLWMSYDTALSSYNFLLQQVGVSLVLFVVFTGLFSVSFMAAESMTRRAFPSHVQLWRAWSPGVANTPTLAGQTLAGYLLLGIFFAYEVGLYLVAHHVLGWWTPSSALVQPDVLATYFPWLTAIAVSLQAGFWEECLFRAVPLAGAALLGKRFGRPTAWIVGAFVVQALVFGAGHAPYPTQPAYARVVELIVPSVGFGLLYLYFGLVPAIVLHYAYDVTWFAMPLFTSSAPGAWVDRTILVLLALVPAGVVLARAVRAGGWTEVDEADRNRAWEPPAPTETTVAEPAPDVGAMSPAVRRLLPVAGLAGLVLWLVFAGFESRAPPIDIGRDEAVRVAREELERREVELSPAWRTMASAATAPSPQHRFVWQEGGAAPFDDLMDDYLGRPRWVVRFARFEGDVAERAEEYRVHVSGAGEAVRFTHVLPEARPGADLNEEQARQIAGGLVRERFEVASGDPAEPGGLREISAETRKLPERRDWTFTYEHPAAYPLEEGSARVEVEIAGEEVADARRFVHVPEEWERADRDRQVVPGLLAIVSGVVAALVLVGGAVGGGIAWARGRFSVRAFTTFLGLALALGVFQFVNSWPVLMAGLSTAMPVVTQVVIFLAGTSIAVLLVAAALGLVAGWVHRIQWEAGPQSAGAGQALLVGVSLGLTVVGLRAALASLGSSLAPAWPSYDGVDTLLPLVGTALSPLMSLLTTTLFLLLVFSLVGSWTRAWTRRTGAASAALLALGFLGGAGGDGGLVAWLAAGVVTGVALVVGYRLVLRYDLTVLPVAVAAVMIPGQLQDAVFGAFPGATAGRLAAAVLLAATAVAWSLALRRERSSPA